MLFGFEVTEQVVLEVQDNGLGLTEAQQSSLFTMFRRLHSHVEGSGVGLYLIERLLENAGGTIAVHSQLAVGSTFTVALPRARAQRVGGSTLHRGGTPTTASLMRPAGTEAGATH